MSFLSRRPSRLGPHQEATRRLTHRLLGGVVAGFMFTSSVSARPAQQRPLSAKTSFSALLVAKYSQPYLAIVGPTPLRFASPLPDFSPELALAATETPEPIAEVAPASDPAPAGAQPGALDQEPALATTTPVPASKPLEAAPSAPVGPPPVSILPDDLERRVTPEDFLPFFLPPQLPSAPPSQATYQQK